VAFTIQCGLSLLAFTGVAHGDDPLSIHYATAKTVILPKTICLKVIMR
jgi:hypothetical protein